MIADQKHHTSQIFVGRQSELETLLACMTRNPPTSVNVHGPQRIGKSSLAGQFCSIWSKHFSDQDKNNYAVAFLNLLKCVTVTDFYREIAKVLLDLPEVHARPGLAAPLQNVQDYDSFEAALVAWKKQQVRPVLCLDEFNHLCDIPSEFTNNFFKNLRLLVDGGLVMLVMVTRKPLGRIQKSFNLSFHFFNLGQHIELRKFTNDEVRELLTLPCLNAKAGSAPCLTKAEQDIAWKWAGNHPFALSLAASFLCQYRHTEGAQEARHKFNYEINNNISLGWWWRICNLPISGEAPDMLNNFAMFIFNIGNQASNIGKTIFGFGVIIVILLILTGIIPAKEFYVEFIKPIFVK
ncbi:MAG: AAA-like domain-containing protein [Magnetococcus sp. DMHC-1]